MARALAIVVAILSLTVQTAFAEGDSLDIPATIQDVADKNGVNPVDLAGAVFSTGLDPDVYLCRVGEGPCPKPVVYEASIGVYDLLAGCESTGNWHANTGNGYFGGVQMDMAFWKTYNGYEFADRPDHASRSEQIIVAQRGHADRGWQPWPRCRIILGLR